MRSFRSQLSLYKDTSLADEVPLPHARKNLWYLGYRPSHVKHCNFCLYQGGSENRDSTVL